MEGIGNDSISLNERLQIKPYSSDGKTASYRSEVVVYRLEQDLEFETGKTAENPAYGKGGYSQYYMPQKLVQDSIKNGKLKEESESGIFLSNNMLTKDQFEDLSDRHDQLLLRRNLFCHLKAKLDTLDIFQNSQNPDDVKRAKEDLERLDKDIKLVYKDISESCLKIGRIPSPLYDRLNEQLAKEIRFREAHPNALLMSNNDIEMEADKTFQEIADKSDLYILTLDSKGEAQEVSDNLFRKIDGYDPKKDWNEIDVEKTGFELTDVMEINRHNREARERIIRNYSKTDVLGLRKANGDIDCLDIDSVFNKESAERIRNGRNGLLSEPLETRKGQLVKIYFNGNCGKLAVRQEDGKLRGQLDKLHLSDYDKNSLLAGESVRGLRIDRDLNRIVRLPQVLKSYSAPLKRPSGPKL